MNRPTFTVIITTYNRRDILPRAIRSVLGQTYGEFELLVIDNGSTDDTESVVRSIGDGRIRYVRNPRPSRSCDAPRNLGIEMARGGLCSLLDDDDIWYPNRLEKVKAAFDENPDASAVCHYENLNTNGMITGVLRHGPWSDDMYERLLYEGNCLSTGAITIKTDLLRRLGGFDLRKEFCGAADYELWIRMAALGTRIHFIEDPLGEFSLTGINFSTADPSFGEKIASLVKMHIVNYEKKPLWAVSKRGMWKLLQLYAIALRSYMKRRDYLNGLKCSAIAAFFIIRRPSLTLRLISRLKRP